MPYNFQFALLQALNNSQIQQQMGEIIDAKGTMTLAQLEASYMQSWDNLLQAQSQVISGDASKGDQNQLTADQTQYQVFSTESQTQQSMLDSNTQQAQQATGQDGTNMQQQAQLVTTLTSISATLASLLGHSYG